MIQNINGMVMVKGDGEELLNDLACIVFALAKKGFPLNDLIESVSSGMAHAMSDDSDEYMKVLYDKEIPKKKEPDLEITTEPLTEDMLHKMFGDLFHE